MSNKLAIIGAGPSGMGCARELAQSGQSFQLFDRSDVPGGLCRTVNFHGYLFDIGGHRFLTRSPEVQQIWEDTMGPDLLSVSRLSRIFYRRKFFDYPLSFMNTIINLGPLESFLCVVSYLRSKWTKSGDENTFEGWVINHFGHRLYNIFFRTYTEKVWQTACRDISAEWAKQRITGLSLRVAAQKAIFGNQNGPKTLTGRFYYPRGGPGEMYRRMELRAKEQGGQFQYHSQIESIEHEDGRIHSICVQNGKAEVQRIFVDYVFSSIPLPHLIHSLKPAPPVEVIKAADQLQFRSYLVVNVILDKKDIFPDQWIYIHSPDIQMGRIQNYKNWAPGMVADLNKTSLGLEYFCTKGDELWSMNDVDLIQFALEELEKTGIVSRKHLIDGFVIRAPYVYPSYSLTYQKQIKIIRDYLGTLTNMQTMGRQGLFRYCNSDHALLTGIYAARNYLQTDSVNLWDFNINEYEPDA